MADQAETQTRIAPDSRLTPAQEKLRQLWQEHVRTEFVIRDADEAVAAMVDDAYVNHVPVLSGGFGKPALRQFYARHFIPQMPSDVELIPVSQTIGSNRLVDEMIVAFTHTVEMDWMLPEIAPTGRRVEVPLVAIVEFRDGKVAHEHIYWDQASLGLLDRDGLPVAGIESARKVVDPSLPANTLIRRST